MDTSTGCRSGYPTWDDDEIGVGPTEQRFGVIGVVTTERIQD